MLTPCEKNWCIMVLVMIIACCGVTALGVHYVIYAVVDDTSHCVHEDDQTSICMIDEEKNRISYLVVGVVMIVPATWTLIWIIRQL